MSSASNYSSLKIFHHKDLLDNLKLNNTAFPIYIRIKPTNKCNHNCSYCTYGSGKSNSKSKNRGIIKEQDSIEWDKMQEIIIDMAECGVKAVTFSGGGEPLLYPKIIETVDLIKEHKIDLSLITNGQLLQGEIAKRFYKAKWIRISFDSPDAEEYSKIRAIPLAAFKQVCDNIEKFAENKRGSCTLGINFVVSKYNYHRVYEAAELLKKLGVDNIKFAAVVDNDPNYHLGIKDSVIAQIHRAQDKLTDNSFSIINNYETDCDYRYDKILLFENCYTCKLVTVIAADSCLYACHTRAYDKNAFIGNLKEKSFKEVWQSDETQKRLTLINPANDCKNFCAYEDRNMIIESYLKIDENHLNFI